ncbi:mammalian cell entry protein [Mycobacterium paraffinicum]|uniref:Mammalian cell entry protein n=1 Tax=Mycobacterium paraffinicum TaxID=53378 RepID=A0A1Q4I1Q0_9MYCO|nr:MlaD family protein [Mycobacterium paraffinicum]OJZ75904.1 mammalian cell entry protein [Mycobacterium paraffinicum]
MHLSRRVRLQLVFFAVITVVAGGVMTFAFVDIPNVLFGIGHYRVTVDLPVAAGLYENANVTYRGTEVGRVEQVHLTDSGVAAVLSLQSGIAIPADLQAEVHSQTAVGEQFIEFVPRSAKGPALKNGDVIPLDRTTVPPNINSLLSATNEGLLAIPHDNLRTAIDELSTAVGGLGPELARFVKGSTALLADARTNLDALTNVVDHSKPILDAQSDSSDSIQAWAANLAVISGEVKDQDLALRGVLENAPGSAEEGRALFERLHPTLPLLMANLVGVGQVAVTYRADIEQLLVLLPQLVQTVQGAELANRDIKSAYRGVYLSFNLNLNEPPPCTTGYLPANQVRSPSEVDYPDRPPGDMYCRVPQDSRLNVRGVRNAPCETRPGKRAPTVKMCESDEEYVPLNDGNSWKGDPNATYSGQAVPQPREPTAPPPPVAVATYDPATGTYTGPDGRQYTQSDLAAGGGSNHRWQDMLVPPKGN